MLGVVAGVSADHLFGVWAFLFNRGLWVSL